MLQHLRRIASLAWLGVLLMACMGCQVPIRTANVRPEQTQRDLDANAINGRDLSQDTQLVLNRLNLKQEFERDPISAIGKLHAAAIAQPLRVILFALAETSYLSARRGYGEDGYLAAAVYAYLYLFGTELAPPPNPYGRSFRVACELYNRGLLEAFCSPSGQRFLFKSGSRELPFGRLEIRAERSGFQWSAESFDEFVPADNVRIIGLSSRRRYTGLGVPLIAILRPESRDLHSALHIPPRSCFAATAFLRVDGSLADLGRNGSAILELHSAFDVPSVQIADRTVPLEVDLTAPLAYQLTTSKGWSFELGALLHGAEFEELTGMWSLLPYQPGKIPVVFVHGTASSPVRWAEMFNELNADADIRSAYQFWFFTYTTGNPILYSASLLRDALTNVVQELDPEGRDPNLRNMVLVGHSQGGNLVKMQVIHTGTVFWKNVEQAHVPLEKLSEAELQSLRSFFIFEPLSIVKRVVFIATPQRGSFVAGGWIGRLFDGIIRIPSRVGNKLSSMIKSQDVLKKIEKQIPTSIDNMTPDHPFVKALASIDIAPWVHAHSIIAVNGAGPPEKLDDGVVQYKSAHLEHADSEFVVRSGHSCQANPYAIQEVRRILLEHLRASGKLRP